MRFGPVHFRSSRNATVALWLGALPGCSLIQSLDGLNSQEPCKANAGPDGKGGCVCDDGYQAGTASSASASACVDVDECSSEVSVCAGNQQCENTEGSFRCGCPDTAVLSGDNCVDRNECNEAPGPCPEDVDCVNKSPGFVCVCPVDGYRYNATTSTCDDIDECSEDAALCGANAVCTNTSGAHQCTCVDGFEAIEGNCTDIDECAADSELCGPNAVCTNMPGSHGCACDSGYEAIGESCVDVDECEAAGVCGETGADACVNLEGSASCYCGPGKQWRDDACVAQTRIATGADHTLLVKDGKLYAWGLQAFGKLGNAGFDPSVGVNPVRIGTATDWATPAATVDNSCALRTTGRIDCWGYHGPSAQTGTGPGSNNGGVTIGSLPVQEATGSMLWRSVGIGNSMGCGTRLDGSLWCWGTESAGEFANGETPAITAQGTPLLIELSSQRWVRVEAGRQSLCGLTEDASLWCWGENDYGQVGNNGSGTDIFLPAHVAPGSQWVHFSVGVAHVCAIDTLGGLWCWGRGTNGRLGILTTTHRDEPVQVMGSENWSNWIDVSAGLNHSCGIRGVDGKGDLYCWGGGEEGQLGLGAGELLDKNQPVLVSNEDWTDVDCGGSYTCGIKADGSVWCWGYNHKGQAGLAEPQQPNLFVPTAVVLP